MTNTQTNHPRHRLSELLQNPVRFSIMAAVDRAEKLSFKEIRDALEVTDSALSKQISALEQAGYVNVQKSFVGKLPRTMVSLTKQGRTLWVAHLETLREIAGSI